MYAGENFTWTSDQPLSQLAVVNPSASAGCTLPLTGVGTSTVGCTGKGGGGGPYNGVVVSADTPSNIALTMTTFARSGIAFAIQTSKITLNKAVDGRVAGGDSFDVSVTSPEGTTAGTASTGTSDAATTGGEDHRAAPHQWRRLHARRDGDHWQRHRPRRLYAVVVVQQRRHVE